MNREIQQLIDKTILEDLKRGRPGWDLPHTKAVVHYMQEILKFHPDLDETVMLLAAYTHDWGYADAFTEGEGSDLESIRALKAKHMDIGAEKVNVLFKGTQLLTQEQLERIMHLVRMHDKLEELNSKDELVLMEADTLGALDPDLVEFDFSKEDNDNYINNVIKIKRLPLFITEWSKERLEELIQKRINWYIK